MNEKTSSLKRTDLKPWLNENGKYRTDKEIELLGKGWNYHTWDEYFKSLEGKQKEEQVESVSSVEDLTKEDITDMFYSFSDVVELPHLKIAVKSCLNMLPERQKEIVLLTYWEKETQAQIAQKLNITRSSVQVHLRRAREAIKKLIISKKFNLITEKVREIAM